MLVKFNKVVPKQKWDQFFTALECANLEENVPNISWTSSSNKVSDGTEWFGESSEVDWEQLYNVAQEFELSYTVTPQ